MSETKSGACCGCNGWTWSALAAALAATVGSLWLSLGMNLIPCPLCYYQRTFVLAAFGVLAAGLLTPARETAYVSLLALPPALAGLSVAVVHVRLEARGTMECPPGLFDLGTAPQQGLAGLALLAVLLLIDAGRRLRSSGLTSLLSVMVLGVLLGYGAVKSVKSPNIPQTGKLVGCRPPAK